MRTHLSGFSSLSNITPAVDTVSRYFVLIDGYILVAINIFLVSLISSLDNCFF